MDLHLSNGEKNKEEKQRRGGKEKESEVRSMGQFLHLMGDEFLKIMVWS